NSASFTFQVQDDGGTAFPGSADLDGTADPMSISILAVNNPPTAASGSVTPSEDTDYAFKTTDFGFANTAGESDTLNGVKISTLPASGTLYLGSLGNPGNPGDLISLGNIPNLKFHPNTNANGSPLTSFLFQVQDTGGTATITAGAYSASGIDLDPAPKTMQIVVTSVNDAPPATGSTVTVSTQAPGQTHVFTINDFGFADN